MNKLINLINKIQNKLLRIYRKKVFIANVNNATKDVKILGKVYLNATNVVVGRNVTFYPGVYLWGDGEIVIGNNVDIGVGTIIFSKKKVIIKNDVSIAGHCYIIDCNHTINKNELINKQPLDCAKNGITIEEDVWISAGCKIIKGANIRKGAVIGATSMVNTEIPVYKIAAGIPAKIIGQRK